MSSAKHVIRVDIKAESGEYQAVCSCGWSGKKRTESKPALIALAASWVRMDGLQHGIESAASVLPEAMRPVFED